MWPILAAAGRWLGARVGTSAAATAAAPTTASVTAAGTVQMASSMGALKKPGTGKTPVGSAEPRNSGSPAPRGKWLDRAGELWVANSVVRGGAAFLGLRLPATTHTIMVSGKGGPKSNLGDVWRLVLATAFGRYRGRIRRVKLFLPDTMIDAVWNVTEKAVSIRLSYELSSLSGLNDVNKNAEDFDLHDPVHFLAAGPSTETIGANWPQWMKRKQADDQVNAAVVGGVRLVNPGATRLDPDWVAAAQKRDPRGRPLNPNLARLVAMRRAGVRLPDALEDDGRLITTAAKKDPKVQPPQPPLDANVWIALVSNALTDPCYLPSCPPKKQLQDEQPTDGKTFYTVAGNDDGHLDPRVLEQQAEDYVSTTNNQDVSMDGYPQQDLSNPDDPVDARGDENAGLS